MSEEAKEFSLVLFKEQTLKDMLNVEPEDELYVKLFVPCDAIIEGGKPVPYSAKHNKVYGFVVPETSYLVHNNGDKSYAVTMVCRNGETSIMHMTGIDSELEINLLLDQSVDVNISDLNDPEVMAKLNELDPEALKGIIEDLSGVSVAE